MNDVTKFDAWLADDGPAALVIREHLIPVEGADGVLFPATFAKGDDFPGGYNIDPPPETVTTIVEVGKNGAKKVTVESTISEKNVCLVDSVGAQANRIEPLFKKEKYAHLVPQVVVKAGEKEVNLLEAGHRAGDALFRCSELQKELQDAFKAVLQGDSSPLAKIAPTSLVFGVWDSRDTQAKLSRVVSSSIRAFNVRRLTRGAVYIPPVNYADLSVFSDEDLAKAEGDSKNPLAKRGFVHVPASGSHGGVIAGGGVRRDATLSLAALRLLAAGSDEKKTLALRRYVLGLALTAFTYPPSGYLRQGCNLVVDPDKPREFIEVRNDGQRVPTNISHEEALTFATAAAKAFGVGGSRKVDFDTKRASADVKGEVAEGDKPTKKSGKK